MVSDLTNAFCKTEYTRVVSGEPKEIEHSAWKVCIRVPLLDKNGARVCSFNIATYSYEARVIELNEIPEPPDIAPVAYFEIYNVYSGKMERVKQSGDALVDEGSLKHLLKKLYLELEEISN